MEEYFFTCPYCIQEISMLIDVSLPEQEYIEDCEVCCNPIEVKVSVEDQEITYFQVISIEQ
jgi:transcription elongation factor Elf1